MKLNTYVVPAYPTSTRLNGNEMRMKNTRNETIKETEFNKEVSSFFIFVKMHYKSNKTRHKQL